MKTLWDFIIKHEFWFLLLLFIGLEFADYKTGEWWISFLATLVLITAILRLVSRKKGKSE
jgi:membrane protein insertase Oxa1/YidC/SpoIIIJ